MGAENWHTSFNPKKFLSRVNLDKLIEHNEAYNENKTPQGVTPCILCNSKQGPGLLLNDKSYLCKSCFSDVSTISYPEKYENNRRNYLRAKESKRIALEALTERYGYNKEGNPVEVFSWLSIILLFIHVSLIVVPAVLFLISFSVNASQEKKLKAWNEKREEWEKLNRDPPAPVLKNFHDPWALLTEKDRKVLKVFNNWPGYPPFWKYLREIVIKIPGASPLA